MNEVDAEVPVTEVRVLEDRANVLRRGQLSLPEGRSLVRVRAVAPVLADKTLVAKVEGAKAQNARVLRKLLPKRDERKGEHAEVVRQLEAKREEVNEVRSRITRTGEELSALEVARRLLVSEIADDVSWSQATPEAWSSAWRECAERERSAALGAAQLGQKLKTLKREEHDLANREAVLRTPASTETAWIELDIVMSAPRPVTIELQYLVPAACWRPQHRATLREGELTMQTDACVAVHG